MTTISSSTTLGITLSNPSYINPVVVEPGVSISGVGAGIVGSSSTPGYWTIQNGGALSGLYGVFLNGGGTVYNAAAASIIGSGSGAGIEIINGAGTINNSGTILGVTGLGGSFGVRLSGGGLVVNGAAASIRGNNNGVIMSLKPGTVVNYGSIGESVFFGAGILQSAGGSVTNAVGGSISGGYNGVKIQGDVGTVVNDGAIAATASKGVGVSLQSAGSVTNAASASILGHKGGVYLYAGGTVTNAGTITGVGGKAVYLGGTGTNLLVADPGAVFSGAVVGGAAAKNTLELASAGSVGTLNGIGSEFINFGSIAFDAGADWFISVDTAGLSGTIVGFGSGDTIELTGITATYSAFSGGVLTLAVGGSTIGLNMQGSPPGSHFLVTNVASGADISLAPPCFRAGTRIHTARGEVRVETLRAGETVLAYADDGTMVSQPVIWIGRRSVDCRHHPNPTLVWPVRVRAGAFGPGRPARDLFLSPDHALFLDGVLIPVKYLINDRSITQMPVPAVRYFHIELATHAVILAEGLPVESYLDVGDRANFANGGKQVALFPEFATRVWEAHGCAKVVVSGPQLQAVRARVDQVAA